MDAFLTAIEDHLCTAVLVVMAVVAIIGAIKGKDIL